jgi:uncharacterized membrane protein HdeD (DUF308 family)
MNPDAAHGTAGLDTSMPPPPRPIEHRDLDPRGWWLSVVGGTALALLGVWMLANPFRSVGVLAALVGASLVVSGVVEAIAERDEASGTGPLAWVAGGLLVAAGLVVLAWPDITLWALAVVAGATTIVVGIGAVAVALGRRGRPGWPAQLALGLLGIAVGAAVLAWPDATLVILAVLLGLRAVGVGVLAVAMGVQAHRLTG